MLNILEIERLSREIRDGFSGSSYPGAENLVREESLPNPDAKELLDAIEGRTWEEASPFLLTADLTDCIPYFQPEGFRYYLPAFLLFLLSWDLDDSIGHNIYSALEVRHSDDKEMFRCLTSRERSVVAEVLKILKDELPGSAGSAYYSYWFQFAHT